MPAPTPQNEERFQRQDFVEIKAFQSLRGISAAEVLEEASLSSIYHGQEQLVNDLRDIINLTRDEMARLNAASPLIPIDKPESIIEYVTRSSCRISMLGVKCNDDPRGYTLEGFSRIFLDSKDFPDVEHNSNFPAEFLNGDYCRFDRFFVSEKARIYDGGGGAAEHLIDAMYSLLSPTQDILAMILESGTELDPAWLVAKRALTERGFTATRFPAKTETFETEQGPRSAEFRYYTYPPRTALERQQVAAKRRSLRQRLEPLRARMAQIVGNVPTRDAIIVHIGYGNDAWNIANNYPQNAVYSVISNPATPEKKQILPNLIKTEQALFEQHQDLLGNIDAVSLFGALPDIAVFSDADAFENLHTFFSLLADGLKNGGRLIVRDTVRAPFSDDYVQIALSETEVVDKKYGSVSAAAAFRELYERSRLHPRYHDMAATFCERDGQGDTFYRAIVSGEFAAEARAKIPYADDVVREVERLYTAYTPNDLIETFTAHGFRLVYAGYDLNQWRQVHHYNGKVIVSDVAGNEISKIPTHMRVVAEKVAENEVLHFNELVRSENPQHTFIEMRNYVRVHDADGQRTAGETRSVVHRPKVTVDILPFSIDAKGQGHVIGRRFPRPILKEVGPLPNRARYGEFVTEQIGVISPHEMVSNEQGVLDVAKSTLERRAQISLDDLVDDTYLSHSYFTAPDTTDEHVIVKPLRIVPHYEHQVLMNSNSDYSTDGTRISTSFEELLSSCQAGGMSDARIERALYRLMLDEGMVFPESILDFPYAPVSDVSSKIASAEEVFAVDLSHERMFERIEKETREFFTVAGATYKEVYANGETGKTVYREFAIPHKDSGLSNGVASVLPVAMHNDELYVGIHRSIDMPISQEYGLGSFFPTAPLFYVPKKNIESFQSMDSFLRVQAVNRFGLFAKDVLPLGEAYFSSPGLTPQMIFPHVLMLENIVKDYPHLHFVKFQDVIKHRDKIKCGQLLTLLYRLGHVYDQFS